MATVTSSRSRRPGGVGDVASLVRRLRALGSGVTVPLLVVRVRGLERLAWRSGRGAAGTLERRSLESFVATAGRILRASDVIAHDDDSEDFVVALLSPTRNAGSVATPTDCRATLARLASSMAFDGEARVDTGWTLLHGVGNDGHLARAIETALERGNRERERYDFFSTLGHELRTPLTSIRGYLETLIEGELEPQTARKFLEVARAEAERLGRLVDGLFELSLLDMRGDSARTDSCELVASVVAAIDAIAPTAVFKNVSLTLLSGERRDVAIGSDRFLQILINILENAVKHGRENGRIEISFETSDDRYVEIRIDDDGPGIDVREREAVFSLAKRGEHVTARGSGIGLAVVRLMAERIGGEVDVGASPMGGAQFRVRLPLLETGDEVSR